MDNNVDANGDGVVSVEEQTSYNMQQAQSIMASSMFNAPLASLRAQNPFVTIEQWPGVISAKLLAGVAQDVNLPSGCKMIRFKGNGDYFVTRNGNAVIPARAFAADGGGDGVMYKPESGWIFTGEDIKQFSVISVADSLLSISYICQQ